MAVITLTGLTRNNTLDHGLPTEINNPSGLCWFNGYWRIPDFDDATVYALNTSFERVSTEDITNIPNGGRMAGLTKTATHLLILFSDGVNHYVRMYDTNNNFVMQFTLTGFPSDTTFTASIAYDETNNRILVGVRGPTGGVGHIGAFDIPAIVTGTTPSTALISSASFDLTTGQQRSDAMVWHEGYVITIDPTDDRFYVYNLSDQSLVSDIDDTVSPNVNGLGLKDGSLYLADRTDDAIDGWDIDFTSIPDAPTGLSGTATSSTVSLTWDDPDNDTITGYEISRKTGSGSYSVIESDTGSDAQSYADTTVAADTTYTYKIQAINDTGDSADSNEFLITTASTATVPDTPTGLSTIEVSTGVKLSWTDPSDSTITDYAIFRKTGTGAFSELTTTDLITGTSYIDTTIDESTEYTYKIQAINDTGDSGDSSEVTITTADTTAPTFEVDGNTADFATTVAYDGTYTFKDVTDIVDASTTVSTITGDDVDTSTAGEYLVTYTVTDAAGNSSEIVETVTVLAEILTVPDTPTGLGGTQTHEEVNLMWDNPNDDTITGYRIFRRIGTAAYTTLVADTASADVEYTDSTVSADTTYTYIIRATNATGNSGNSTSFSITTDPTPDTTAPTILTAVPAAAAVTEPEVSWRVTFSEDVENVDTTDFAIRQTGVPQEDPDSITVVSASVYDVFYTLPDVGIYHFRIRNNSNIADLSGNERTQSGEIPNSTITYTAAATVPEDPTGLAGSEVSGEVALTWDDPTDDTITGYKIFRKTGTAAYTTLVEDTASTTQSYTDDTVSEGTTYTYKIQAVNDTGNSGDSNEFEIRTIKHYTVLLSDSLSVTDAVTRLKAATRSLTDSISLSDSVTRSKLSNTILTLADSLSISDAITRIRATTVHLTEDSATSTTSQAITVNADKSPDLDIADASVGDVSEAVYDSPSFDVSDEETSPSGVTFSPDGLKMFVVGFSSDHVYQYILSIAWDITTAIYNSVSLNISEEDTSPTGITFSSDGLKMFMVGAISDSVHQYSLSTAWDLSTAIYDMVSFDVSDEDSQPHGLIFSPDGLKMFMVGISLDNVYQYTLSTAWDITTAVYHSVFFDVSNEDTQPRGFTFSSDGTKMFIIGNTNDSIYQYSLSTAWDITTAEYDSVLLDINDEDAFPHGLAFSSDGTKMFVVGDSSNRIHPYDMPVTVGVVSDDIIISDDYRTSTDGVSITINTTHTDRTSLSFRVRNPAGDWSDSINLADSASQSFNLTFPNESDTDGTWRIEITDDTPGTTGTLDSWDLDITTTSVTETTVSGSLFISDSITRRKISGARVSLSDSLSITDSITRLKAATRSLTDSITLSDILHGSTAVIVRLTDSLSVTDAVTRLKTTTRSLTDSLSISDGITWLKGTTRSLTDSISLSDSVTRSKSVIRSLFDPKETIGSAVPVGNPDQNVQGMAWTGSHIIQLAGTGSAGYLAAHPYNYDTNILTENTTITLTTRRLRACAYVASVAKVIVASINPDIVHDYDVSADGTFTNERELIVEDLPESLHGIAYHALSGRVVGVDVTTDMVYDWLYDPVAGTLSDRRPLTSNILATPRSVATYGIKTLVISEIASDNLYAFDYDFVAGVLSMQRTLVAETDIYGSTFVRDRLFFARVNTSGISDILYRSYTPRAFVIADAITKTVAHTKTLADSLSITDSMTKIQVLVRSLTDTIIITDAIHVSTAGMIRLADSLAITDSITRLKTTTRSLTDSLSVTDSITKLKAATRSLTDSISLTDTVSVIRAKLLALTDSLSISDTITKIRAVTVSLTEGSATTTTTADTLGIRALVGSAVSSTVLLGMAYHDTANTLYQTSRASSISTLHSRSYDGTDLATALTEQEETAVGVAYTALAVSANKLLVAQRIPTAAVHDYDISLTDGALTNKRTLTVAAAADALPVKMQGMSVHISSGKLAIADVETNTIIDYNYDSTAGTLSGKRTLTVSDSVFTPTNPRSISFHGDKLVVVDRTIDKIYSYNYDTDAGTIGGETELADETDIQSSVFVGDDLLFGDATFVINKRLFTPGVTTTTGAALRISDALTTSSGAIILLSDSLAITDAVTRLKAATRTLADTIMLSDVLHAGTAGMIRLTDSLSVTDSATRLKTTTRSLTDSLSITDAVIRIKTVTRSLTDSLSISDMVTKLRHVPRSLTDSLSVADTLTKSKGKTNTLSDSLSISDSITRLKAAKRSLTESLRITETVYASTAGAIRLADSLSILDSITSVKAATRSLSDSLSISDTVSEIRTELRSLTDSLSISDTLTKIKAITVHLTEGAVTVTVIPATEDSLGAESTVGTSLASDILRGMTYHSIAGMLYYISQASGTGTIRSRVYNATTGQLGAALSTQDTQTGNRLTALATSGNKLLVAQAAPTDAIYDYDISTTSGAISNIRTLTVSDIPTTVHGMSVHQASGKVAMSDVTTNTIYDYDYNSATGVLDGKRTLTIPDSVFTPQICRTIAFHDDKLVVTDSSSDRMYSYDYDSVAGTISGETELVEEDETDIQSSVFVGDDLLFIRTDRTIYKRLFTAGMPSSTSTTGSGVALTISDALTVLSGASVSLSDSLSITDAVTRVKAATRSLADSIILSDIIHGGTAGIVRLTDSLSITDAVTRTQTRITHLTDSLSITDAVTKSQAFVSSLSDSISITDRLHVPQDYIRHLTDSLSISDSARAFKRNITRSRIYRATLNRVFRAKLG